MDNIEVDPQSTTATGSLHGTGISLSQNVSQNNPGVSRSKVDSTEPITNTKLDKIPDFYALVPPVMMKQNNPMIPQAIGPARPSCDTIDDALQSEKQ